MNANDEAAELLAKRAEQPGDAERQTRPSGTGEAKPDPQMLRIFISYASEDVQIAEAIAREFTHALGTHHANIHLDRWFLQAGDDFKLEIEEKLDQTDYLIVVFTGQEKESHGWGGWELGYFTAVMKQRRHAKVVPMYLNSPPDTIRGVQGFNIGFSNDLLDLPPPTFKRRNRVGRKEQICGFVADLQKQVKALAAKANKPAQTMKSPRACIQDMRTAIFAALRRRVKKAIRPQKQIVFEMTDAQFKAHRPDLPPDALLRPTGDGNPMQIFGLGSSNPTWKEFRRSIADKPLADSWQHAITTVIDSSFPENVNVDNSQIIVADDGKSYRIILNAGISYYDRREFSLSFVDTLKPRDLGNEASSRLLKGLAIVCRFRFMFLEGKSDFSDEAITTTPPRDLSHRVRDLLHELNMLRHDAVQAKFEKAKDWEDFIDWNRLVALNRAYGVLDEEMRAIAGRILRTRSPRAREKLQRALASVIRKIETLTRSENAHFIREMARQLADQADVERPSAPRAGRRRRAHGSAQPGARRAGKTARRAPAAKRRARR